MVCKAEPQVFINDLQRVATARTEFAGRLGKMAEILTQAEREGEHTSGQLALTQDIENLRLASKNLREGVFRLLVLGDMKRGKSTFLNALIGEDLLPRNVTACTALLTIVCFGPQKKVTVYFTNGIQPESLSFEGFKRRYTIDPKEAKRLEEQSKQAFPDVDYAIVEYPLPLLEKGVEIVDSPGLNDTEERNERVLNYIKNCHAILFVLSATQQYTLVERRYLEDYIKDRGFTVFFLINRWDEIKGGLTDKDDPVALRAAEEDIRTVFKTNLSEYCVVDGKDLYEERAFEISALNALRQRLNKLPLAGTGFPEFMGELNNFLTKERASSELRQAKAVARQVYGNLQEAIGRRFPLLDKNVEELKASIQAVQPEFGKLVGIRDAFMREIQNVGAQQADLLAASFYTHFSALDKTFETDFVRYQPQLKFLDFLQKKKRLQFEIALLEAFNKYLNDQIATWSRKAEQQQEKAFLQLASSAAQYAVSYKEVTNAITKKVTGDAASGTLVPQDRSPVWYRWVAAAASFATGDFVGASMAASSAFNWKNVAVNVTGLILVNIISLVALHTLLTPIGGLIVTAFLGAGQAEMQRRKFFEIAKRELAKALPQMAQKQSMVVHQAVRNCFSTYEAEVVRRMNEDIQAQRAELDNLLEQKQAHEIDRDAEIKRFNNLNSAILAQWHSLEDSYDSLLAV